MIWYDTVLVLQKKPFLQMARWLKSEQNPWWERICIDVLCSEARLVLFWLCSWDIYEVPDAHYTSLMRNNPWKCWFSWLLQCTGLPVMELKLSGNYDWIGLGISFYLFLSFSFSAWPVRCTCMCAFVCMRFVFIGISIDFEMMLRGTGKSSLWSSCSGTSGELRVSGCFSQMSSLRLY